MTVNDNVLLAELKVELKNLGGQIENLTEEMKTLQNNHVVDSTKDMAGLKVKVAILEKIIYGLIALFAAQLISTMFH